MPIPNDLPLVFDTIGLSDGAAAHIAQFLANFALWFENTHFSQIRRYYEAQRPAPAYDPNQLKLFDPF